jgi:hypothetical protein
MAKVYITRCIVKKSGRSWKKGSVIEDLTDVEIKQGLAEHWLEAVGRDDGDGEETEENRPDKSPGKALLKKAAEAGVAVTEEMTVEEIKRLIAEAKARQ